MGLYPGSNNTSEPRKYGKDNEHGIKLNPNVIYKLLFQVIAQ